MADASRWHFRAWFKGDFEEPPRMIDMEEMDLSEWRVSLLEHMDDCIIMQSTGLFDKNGKEIFEGDVVRWLDMKERVFPIVWKRNGWHFGIDRLLGAPSDFEVIGHIYETSDLLQKNA